MHRGKNWLATLLVFLMLTATGAQAESAKLRTGTVKKGVFTSPDGIRFTLPNKFEIASHGYTDSGVFRISMNGRPNGSESRLIIDLLEEPRDVRETPAPEIWDFLADLGFGEYWKLEETIVVSDAVSEARGFPVRETLMVMRPAKSFGIPFRYVFGRAFSTERFLARVTYICVGTHGAMPENVIQLNAFFDTLAVP